MQCHRCQCEILESEIFKHHDETLCEDCYIDAVSPAKPCNPWAVYLAQTIPNYRVRFILGEGHFHCCPTMSRRF